MDDQGALVEMESLSMAVLDNDTEPGDPIDPTTVTIVRAPAYGEAIVNPEGFVWYQHDGTDVKADTFTYTVNDVNGVTSNEATVTLTVTLVNDPPTANEDIVQCLEGGAVGIDVLANDVDLDDEINRDSLIITTYPLFGTVVLTPLGTFDYTHDGSDNDDSFKYQVWDAVGQESNIGTVTIEYINVNDPPVANDDWGWCPPGDTNPVEVYVNDVDTDPDGLDLASIVFTALPVNGTVMANPDGTVSYTHDGGPTYDDTFSYTIDDPAGVTSNEATVNMVISPYPVPVQVGSFNVSDGDNWMNNPPVYSCIEACALLFGGVYTDYECSTVEGVPDNMAKTTTWGVGGCGVVAQDFKVDPGTGYNCGAPDCATSAYVVDNCTADDTNYCFVQP